MIIYIIIIPCYRWYLYLWPRLFISLIAMDNRVKVHRKSKMCCNVVVRVFKILPAILIWERTRRCLRRTFCKVSFPRGLRIIRVQAIKTTFIFYYCEIFKYDVLFMIRCVRSYRTLSHFSSSINSQRITWQRGSKMFCRLIFFWYSRTMCTGCFLYKIYINQTNFNF